MASKNVVVKDNGFKTVFKSDEHGQPLICKKCLCSNCKEPNCTPCVDCFSINHKLTPVKDFCKRRGY